MERFVKGDVVVLQFPFSNLAASKKRPALVVAALQGDDVVLCQITSQTRLDSYSIELQHSDFKQGGLSSISLLCPNKLFTADRSILMYKAGALKEKKTREVVASICSILQK
jgi:mRNA interferase MazF